MPEVLPNVSSWFLRPSQRPWARTRLFCFPRAGAGASSFRNWAEDCHPHLEAILIQPPGRETRLAEAPLRSMDSLVAAIADALADFLDRPFAFYGHSLGAKAAFETARELRRRRLPAPAHLYAAACPGPSLPWHHPPLRALPDTELLSELQKLYGGVPREVAADPDLRALLVPALRADLTIVETYRYNDEEPLAIPVTCFTGSDDHMTPESDVLAWRRHSSAAFRLRTFPGDHFFPAAARKSILELIASDLSSGGSQLPANPS